jgi:hypothetical protein
MKKILPILTAAILSGLGGYALSNHAGAQAEPAVQIEDPAPGPAPTGGLGAGAHSGDAPYRWMMRGRLRHRWLIAERRGWGLFYPQSDKKLSASDVQTIAQAILLRHGNHTWKVTNVAQNQDNTVSFAFATQSGDVIARFAMNTQTGRIRRIE